jgi:hypothetical protein
MVQKNIIYYKEMVFSFNALEMEKIFKPPYKKHLDFGG